MFLIKLFIAFYGRGGKIKKAIFEKMPRICTKPLRIKINKEIKKVQQAMLKEISVVKVGFESAIGIGNNIAQEKSMEKLKDDK